MTAASPLYTAKTHLADRPGKTRCGCDSRDWQVTSDLSLVTCRMCINLDATGKNNPFRSGGDWIRR